MANGSVSRPAPVRIGDVALAAGVSVATVSKALNGRSDVSAATRERVQAVAADLGFRPNALARSLLTGRTFSVGLLTTDSYGRFAIPLMLGAEDALGSGEVAIVFCDTRDDPQREARQVQALLARSVDGIIVNGRRTEPRTPLPDLPVPVVYSFAASTDLADCSVVADEAGGARLAVQHLLDRGRTRIAHVTGPRKHRSAIERARATVALLRAQGLSLAGGGVRFGGWSESWGRQAARDLLEEVPDLDAVFCGSDQIARGLLDGLREADRRVPDDVAVVGYDNWQVMTAAARPPLTTVDMQIYEIGRVAALSLLSAIDGAPNAGRTVIPAQLVVRESS